MKANPTLLRMKYGRIVERFSELANIPLEDALTFFYESKTYELISQGISFLSGLAETLKSPEATKELVENIIEVDKETGETNIKIPVANKDTILQVFSLIGKLLQ